MIQLLSFAQAEAMNACAAHLPHGAGEFERCGIASQAGERVGVPRVA
ncbi:hypothetical protein P8H27_13530 [Pseudomonas sp. sp1636]|nr:hypothetical protein [Pseudomonas sp. sp1636]MDM8349908.1 hypothetical protein [Pseudomonas sp. sp1636]